jgi:LuxR family maltose regulon positive regulatory protein
MGKETDLFHACNLDQVMGDPLIRTKLRIPRGRSRAVVRAPLQDQVRRGLSSPLTLIVAPAGFGKTTLASLCVIESGLPTAWISLDQADNRELFFLRYLVAALQTVTPSIGSQAASLLDTPEPPRPEALLASIVNDLADVDHEICLVLDDYHVITHETVHTAVNFLLDHSPATLHLLICSRSDPALPIARLRARGHVEELRADDLCFTQAEATRFLHETMGLNLDDSVIAALVRRTEGWAAGLQLAALSLRRHRNPAQFVENLTGTDRYILDYLLEEVLVTQPGPVQEFLLQTSILGRLNASLGDAVTDRHNGSEMLEYLERHNLFLIPLDDDRIWYRYHQLFADLLRARLLSSDHEQVKQLQSRAADWCARNGHVTEAIGYALAAHDVRRAARLIARYWGQISSGGEIETVCSWLAALPEETIRQSAPLAVANCWLLWFHGAVDEMESYLAAAEAAVRGHDRNAEQESADQLPAQVAALTSLVACRRGEHAAAIERAEEALRLIPDSLTAADDALLRSLVHFVLPSAHDVAGDLETAATAYAETIRWSRVAGSTAGVTGITYRLVGALIQLGRLREAERACRDGLAYLRRRRLDTLPAAGILHLALAEVLVERNELEAAEQHVAEGLDLGRGSGRLDAVRNAVRALSRLCLVREDVDAALAAVRDAEAALGERRSALATAELLAVRTHVLLRAGNLDDAARCAREAVRLAALDHGQTGQLAALAATRVLVARSEPAEAVDHLTQALTVAGNRHRWGVALELRVLRALAFADHGDLRRAERDLGKALALAAPEGYHRVFLDEGPSLQYLLVRWSSRVSGGPARELAGRLIVQLGAGPVETQGHLTPNDELIEPLSERELEVLRIMALGRTNQQIADQLVVARGTVKTHSASIYRKLSVANRTQAVARARQLGILP